jgi:hypothetical protein
VCACVFVCVCVRFCMLALAFGMPTPLPSLVRLSLSPRLMEKYNKDKQPPAQFAVFYAILSCAA